jgi:hypothetical protein
MEGSHGVVLGADAIIKGVKGIDVQNFYRLAKSTVDKQAQRHDYDK